MVDAFRIADILIEHALRAHGDDIAIIACYGSRATGLASSDSDLDIFYIPDDGKARSLCCQFVLDDLPYDFWPVSWRFAEEIASATSSRPWDVSASIIAKAKVLHHRSRADLDRFEGLRQQIAELTRPESRRGMVERALREFRTTLFQLGQMRLAAAAGDTRGLCWAGWKLAGAAVNCLALVNQTYFTKGWGANLPQVLEMTRRPAQLEETLRAIMLPAGDDDLIAHAERLTGEVRKILLVEQEVVAERSTPGAVFQDFYFFVVEYTGKIHSACERSDPLAAAAAAFLLQDEICQFMNETDRGFHGTDFNLLGEYATGYDCAGLPDLLAAASRGDLPALARRARELDATLRTWFAKHSIELNILADEEDLRRFLERRDPERPPTQE